MGVPSLGCHCRVCRSQDPHDNRTRPSILLSRDGHHVVIDTTPDFRFQALREKPRQPRRRSSIRTGTPTTSWDSTTFAPSTCGRNRPCRFTPRAETLAILRRTFAYVFDGKPVLSTIPEVIPHVIEGPFELLGTTWKPIPAEHGDMSVLGFRVGGLAYLTDFSRIPAESMPLLASTDDLVLDALRDEPHPMHQTVEQALALVTRAPAAPRLVHAHRPRSAASGNQRAAGCAWDFPSATGLRRSQFRGARVSDFAVLHGPPRSGPRNIGGIADAGAVLSVGNFDGLHLGHQKILRR